MANDPRMMLTIADMKTLVPEWEGTTEMAHSSPEVAPQNRGPMLKTVKGKKTQLPKNADDN